MLLLGLGGWFDRAWWFEKVFFIDLVGVCASKSGVFRRSVLSLSLV